MVKLSPVKKMDKDIMKGYRGRGAELNASQPRRSSAASPCCIPSQRLRLTGMILPVKTLQEATRPRKFFGN